MAERFARVQYFHPVLQVIRKAMMPGEDGVPHGSDFIAQMNATRKRARDAWLGCIQRALQAAVPELESIEIEADTAGRPQLKAGCRNRRSRATFQTEAEFSGGRLRLTALNTPQHSCTGGALLLEESERSLRAATVRTLPTVLAMAQRDREWQIVLSARAPDMLDDEGAHPDEVLVLRVTSDGANAQLLSQIEEVAACLEAGLPISEIVEDLIVPEGLSELIDAEAR